MGISDEESLDEEIAFEFDYGSVDAETKDFENSGNDLEETDPVPSSNNEGGGVGGIGVVDGDS